MTLPVVTLPATPSTFTADELWALCRQFDRAAIAIETRQPDRCPPCLLRLLQEELARRAASAEIDEFLLARAGGS